MLPQPEITLRAILLSIVLAAILAAANTYLALKIGILTSASIPAAIISMGILRFFKSSNILENNQVQTAASAGEAVAGGIVYTIPALVILNYWSGFGYVENFLIAIIGGLLGVLFSIPIRRVLMNEPSLRFPEGRAIAELLKAGTNNSFGLKEMLMGSSLGGIIELLQSGLKIIADGSQAFFAKGSTLFGFGVGFSATMIGAGYLIGFGVGFSFLLGAILNWAICLPALSTIYGVVVEPNNITATVMNFAHAKLRYVGIGAMLLAGIYTLLTLVKPFAVSLKNSFKLKLSAKTEQLRTEQDLPLGFILLGLVILSLALYGLLQQLLPIAQLGLAAFSLPLLLACVAYILVIGFIFSTICGYFSGMVGVSASPGSSIIIAGMLLVAFALRYLIGDEAIPLKLQSAAAITIIVGGIVTGAACIANDNVQDLKVGHLVGSTPWKQQVMLMLGVIVAAAVIPLVMQLLYKVYGIAGSMPKAGMDPAASLPAPPAALMAAVTQAVFNHNLPWEMVGVGMGIIGLIIMVNHFLKQRGFTISILGVAIGMYLPLTTSLPLFFGGMIAYFISKKQTSEQAKQRGNLLACGLVAGAALMDVLLAIPMAILPNLEMLAIMPSKLSPVATILGVVIVIGLGRWFYKISSR